jgi:putative MATE family efflux protein
MHPKSDYLISQKPWQALLIFSLPMIIGNLFQQAYTMADSAVVGRFVNQQALAAIGASYALTTVFICIALGGGIGASVLVSMHFGSREYEKMKTCIFTSLLFFLLVSIVLGLFGLFASRGILTLLRTPADVLDMAAQYLRIYFLGLPFLFMYNVLSAMFNALGKSRIPLYFLIFSSVLNVALDLLLVIRFHMGIAGAAWATLAAQELSAVLSYLVFIRQLNAIYAPSAPCFDRIQLKGMIQIALPSILQQSTVSIGMMLVQSVVNLFGSEILAGFSAAARVESFCIVPMIAIGNAVSSFTAQNLGAHNPDRVVQGYCTSNYMVLVCAAVLCFCMKFFHKPIIALFLGADSTPLASSTGESYLTFIGFFFCFIGFKMAVDGLLRGAGDMKMFTIANLVNLSIRVSVSMIFAPRLGVAVIWYAVSLSWLANWCISFCQYRTQKWRSVYAQNTQT